MMYVDSMHSPEAPDAAERLSVARQLAVRDDHWCFGCGHENPIGLKLRFYVDGDRVWAPWTPCREHQGYEGIVHGGLITTVLDEVMGWAIYVRKLWAVTGSINVRFRTPAHIGRATRGVAWVEKVSGRRVDVRAQLIQEDDGAVLTDASAIFIRVPESQAAAWQGRYIEDSLPD
jgi:acyl-coenzyme A thioesterase PaaI-like protein